jgi:hypothetical protein
MIKFLQGLLLTILFIIAFLWSFASPAGAAEYTPRVGFEYEHEKSHGSTVVNDAFSIIPGIQCKECFINRYELYLEGNQDSHGSTATETKVGVRVRKDFKISDSFSGYFRVLIGHSANSEKNFNYLYWEPGIKYSFNDQWSFTTAYRVVRSIDGSEGHNVNKLRIGPNFDLDKHNGFELRYVPAWDANKSFIDLGTNELHSTALIVEYTYKF